MKIRLNVIRIVHLLVAVVLNFTICSCNKVNDLNSSNEGSLGIDGLGNTFPASSSFGNSGRGSSPDFQEFCDLNFTNKNDELLNKFKVYHNSMITKVNTDATKKLYEGEIFQYKTKIFLKKEYHDDILFLKEIQEQEITALTKLIDTHKNELEELKKDGLSMEKLQNLFEKQEKDRNQTGIHLRLKFFESIKNRLESIAYDKNTGTSIDEIRKRLNRGSLSAFVETCLNRFQHFNPIFRPHWSTYDEGEDIKNAKEQVEDCIKNAELAIRGGRTRG